MGGARRRAQAVSGACGGGGGRAGRGAGDSAPPCPKAASSAACAAAQKTAQKQATNISSRGVPFVSGTRNQTKIVMPATHAALRAGSRKAAGGVGGDIVVVFRGAGGKRQASVGIGGQQRRRRAAAAGGGGAPAQNSQSTAPLNLQTRTHKNKKTPYSAPNKRGGRGQINKHSLETVSGKH